MWLEEKVKQTRKTNIDSLFYATDTQLVDWAQPGQPKALSPRSVEGLPLPQSLLLPSFTRELSYQELDH